MPASDHRPKIHEVPAEPGVPLRPSTATPPERSPERTPGARVGNPFPVSLGDLLVLLIGAALLVWALAAKASTAVLLLASVITVVGFLIPLRKLRLPTPAAAAPASRQPLVLPAQRPEHLLLDLADPTTARLAGAYSRVVTLTAGSEEPFLVATAAAAHQAVEEAAFLVDGHPPANLAEMDELDRRAEAMEAVVGGLRAQAPPLPWPPDGTGGDSVAELQALAAALGPRAG